MLSQSRTNFFVLLFPRYTDNRCTIAEYKKINLDFYYETNDLQKKSSNTIIESEYYKL